MPSTFTCIIVDDEQDAIDLLSSRINVLFHNISILVSCTHWADALEKLRTNKFDILFIDISMPGKNAIELLKLLPGLSCEIIFVTAHDRFALDAFEFSTSGYILKPIDDNRLFAAVNKAIERISTQKHTKQQSAGIPAADKIGVPNNHGIDYINIHAIVYLEAVNKCTKIVTTKGEYTSSLNIGKFQHLIDNHSFFQAHRSYIINLNCILRYESTGLIVMDNKKEIPLSRNVKNDFLKLFHSSY